MTSVIKDVFIYKHETDKGKPKYIRAEYSIVLKNGKVQNVFNDVFGDWGHSVDKNSEIFEYYSNKYNAQS